MRRIFNKIGIFSPADEIFNLAWPLVVFAFLSALYFKFGSLSRPTSNFILYFTGVAALNVVHTSFTFITLFCFPEARNWLNELQPRERYLLIAKWVSLLVILLLFFAYRNTLERNFSAFRVSLIFAWATSFIAYIYHTLRQVEGLTIMYNKNLERQTSLTPIEHDLFRKCEAREKILFQLLIWMLAIGLFFKLLKLPLIAWVAFVLSALLMVMIFLNNYRFPHIHQSNKPIYLLRLIFFPLSQINPVYSLGPSFFHGVEYFFVFRKMWHKTQVPRAKRARLFYALIIPVSIVTAVFSTARAYRGYGIALGQFFPDYQSTVVLIAVVSVAFNFLHFQLDRDLFKMKNAKVRKNIAPLIN